MSTIGLLLLVGVLWIGFVSIVILIAHITVESLLIIAKFIDYITFPNKPSKNRSKVKLKWFR